MLSLGKLRNTTEHEFYRQFVYKNASAHLLAAACTVVQIAVLRARIYMGFVTVEAYQSKMKTCLCYGLDN